MTATSNNEPQFFIQRIYVKDLSYEAPSTPSIFQQKWEPEMNLDLNCAHNQIEKDVYEVVLTVLVTVKNSQTVAFLIEVKQAGIFTVQGVAKDQLDNLMGSYCPNILFPYAREAITSQIIRGSFPQLVLAPINFDALYLKHKEEQTAKKPTVVQDHLPN